MASNFFLEIPLWVLFIITFVTAFLAFEGGVLFGKKHRLISEQEDTSPIGSIVAATLGLLAFLLAFTFGIAAAKFEERRALVLEEANAIETTYLRAGYLEDPYSSKVQSLLKEYVTIRLEALKPENLAEGLKRSQESQEQLWEQAIAVAKKHPDYEVIALFIQSLNNVIDLHSKRVNVGLYIRIPLIIWGALYFVLLLAIVSLGYQFGLTHTRFRAITMLIILTFASVILLIADLDRPQEGLIKVSQQSLIDLQGRFKHSQK